MEIVLAKTTIGLSKILEENPIDLLVVHGDRVEALAGAATSSLKNIRVAHIEGGEQSGTVDNIIRHAISKFSHFHFVANSSAKKVLEKIGEKPDAIFVIGSPETDVLLSDNLPDLDSVKKRYQIEFDKYGIIIFHPVTTELNEIKFQVTNLSLAAKESGLNFVLIQPNNDNGSTIIRKELLELSKMDNFHFVPSMRFEFFLSLMNSADLVLGNSSAGVREAPYFGTPSVNVGSRQEKRVDTSSIPTIINVEPEKDLILASINQAIKLKRVKTKSFGDGNAARDFTKVLMNSKIWEESFEKFS
jgi:UDP-N-acetylglucosamine 2-epimerase (hydrolysing)